MKPKKKKEITSSIKEYVERILLYPNIIPPRSCMRSGKNLTGYVQASVYMRGVLEKYAGLTPDSKVLDVGCGDGRLANGLSRYLSNGCYDGFDVQLQFVEFLKKAYRSKSKFRFKHSDLWHSYYNSRGAFKATEYIFPYPDKSFDVVYLNSIFTHFLPDEIVHYLREIFRVLKPGGRALATYFLANEESLQFDGMGKSDPSILCGHSSILNFSHGNYWTRDDDVMERIVGIDEKWLTGVYREIGLDIIKIVPGHWCGRPIVDKDAHQDFVIASTVNTSGS